MPPSTRRPAALENVLPGAFHETPSGRCWIAQTEVPAASRHGRLSLDAFLKVSPEALAVLGNDPAIGSASLTGTLFLDTETTGLSGGTGTMAFLVGLGFFEGERFRILQLFLRDPGDEPAMLQFLEEFLPRFSLLVTFNGRGFDLPILEARFILARRPFPLAATPHLDLLPPARRLWRERLPSRALTALERDVLGVLRDQEDIPSGVIPLVYRDYLRTGDARELPRIFYHNRMDILSMVTLAARMGSALAEPAGDLDLCGEELLALARWYEEAGWDAEPVLREVLRRKTSPVVRARALRDLGASLRRRGEWGASVEIWQQLALERPDDVLPAVELAKVYEWHLARPALALAWARQALARAQRLPPGPHREQVVSELCHRIARLEGRLTRPVCPRLL
ncbi:MAG: ribonuclease H-like domain-containing protein [Anaerolineae bacterium]|nr:ribonuclease H-like domain-containing protein [Anaerolineae bacterium]